MQKYEDLLRRQRNLLQTTTKLFRLYKLISISGKNKEKKFEKHSLFVDDRSSTKTPSRPKKPVQLDFLTSYGKQSLVGVSDDLAALSFSMDKSKDPKG